MLQAIISEPNELGDYENVAVCAGRPVDQSGTVCVVPVTGGSVRVTTKLNQHFSFKGWTFCSLRNYFPEIGNLP